MHESSCQGIVFLQRTLNVSKEPFSHWRGSNHLILRVFAKSLIELVDLQLLCFFLFRSHVVVCPPNWFHLIFPVYWSYLKLTSQKFWTYCTSLLLVYNSQHCFLFIFQPKPSNCTLSSHFFTKEAVQKEFSQRTIPTNNPKISIPSKWALNNLKLLRFGNKTLLYPYASKRVGEFIEIRHKKNFTHPYTEYPWVSVTLGLLLGSHACYCCTNYFIRS